MHRLSPYFCLGASGHETLLRASEVLDFCCAIRRVHREGGPFRNAELAAIADMEAWSSGVLNQYQAGLMPDEFKANE